MAWPSGTWTATGSPSECATTCSPSTSSLAEGGEDTAPTPTELLVASMASCVAFYARRYLARHHLPTAGLTVTADYTLEPRPARVAYIRVDIQVPDGIPAERLDALLAVASHCTVHNTLADPPR